MGGKSIFRKEKKKKPCLPTLSFPPEQMEEIEALSPHTPLPSYVSRKGMETKALHCFHPVLEQEKTSIVIPAAKSVGLFSKPCQLPCLELCT